MIDDTYINSPYFKMLQDMQRQQQLIDPTGMIGMMQEQQRIWELIHPYSAIEKHIEEMDKINKQYNEIRGITALVATATEDYRIKFGGNIGSISQSLRSLIPDTKYNIDRITDQLSSIYKLEDRFKRVLDSYNIEYILPTQRIVNSFAGIAAACSAIQYASPLANLSLYNSLSYQDFVHKQLYQLYFDIPLIATRRAIVTELAGDLYEASEISTELGYNIFNGIEVSTDEDQYNKANIFNTTNCHIGYIYNSRNNIDSKHAFNNSVPIKINKLGCLIVEKIYSINELNFRKCNSAIFTPTNKSLRACSKLPTTIAINETLFADIIDCLYYLIYEGSGAASRLNPTIDDVTFDPLWWIKYLRLEFRHDIEHGTEKDIKQKFNKIGNTYKSLIGFERPRSQKDWTNAQLMLYMHILTMLESFHNNQ